VTLNDFSQLHAKTSIDVSGGQVNLLGTKVAATQGSVLMQARTNLLLAAAGDIQAQDQVHLIAPVMTLNGTISVDDGLADAGSSRLLLNAGSQLVITGQLSSSNTVDLSSGVNLTLSASQLEEAVTTSNLGNGFIHILNAGSIEAPAVNVQAGGEVLVRSTATADGERIVQVPTITTEIQYITIVNGYINQAVGTIEVPVVTWVDTTRLEIVSEGQIVVGAKYTTMDVTLEQIGYYNPNHPDRPFREYFIEGVDYFNAQVDWSKAGNELLPNQSASAVTGEYTNAGYKMFHQLNIGVDLEENDGIMQKGRTKTREHVKG
jgi:hypothetical protein